MRFIQIYLYLYPSFLGIYERESYFFIGKYVHSYIYEGLGLVDIFDDGFLRIVRKGEVDFGFGKGRKRKLGNKNYGK
ncbi:unnamed protein product [marine sediment metagenome]|uniref:Uncharacterized protein n=1 Tax=marine sediment metagenome TaxID=412755 RepID=X1UVE0_9ZZZZ